MSETLKAVKQLVAAGDVRISEHGYDELSEDDIPIRDLLRESKPPPSSRIIPSFRRDPQCWCYNLTAPTDRYTSCGGFRKDYDGSGETRLLPADEPRPGEGLCARLAGDRRQLRARGRLRRHGRVHREAPASRKDVSNGAASRPRIAAVRFSESVS